MDFTKHCALQMMYMYITVQCLSCTSKTHKQTDPEVLDVVAVAMYSLVIIHPSQGRQPQTCGCYSNAKRCVCELPVASALDGF